MELLPALSFGWLNGWIALALLALADAILFLSVSKPVVARLWDRSQWSRKQRIFTVIGKLISLGGIILLAFTPLKLGTPVFLIGAVIVLAGLAAVIKSVVDFGLTPLDQPVTRGLYRISRHPQVVGAGLVLLGASISIGSWAAVILWALGHLFGHWGILAEEEACLKRYGEPYRQYLQSVPRYFLVFSPQRQIHRDSSKRKRDTHAEKKRHTARRYPENPVPPPVGTRPGDVKSRSDAQGSRGRRDSR